MTEPNERDQEMAQEACRNWARDGAFIWPEVAKQIAVARAEGEAKGRREAIEECAKKVGSWPTVNYGDHDQRLKVTAACVDMSAALRALIVKPG